MLLETSVRIAQYYVTDIGKEFSNFQYLTPTPVRNGKNFFAFLDVLDHLEAKKN